MIHFDLFYPIWPILIHFDQLWSILNHLDPFDPFWSTWHILIYFDVFFRYSDNYGQVKVVSLNVWGMPVLLGGGEYKTERMEAIADQIGQGDYDVFLMQELWLQADHQVLSRRLPTNYVMTAFRRYP